MKLEEDKLSSHWGGKFEISLKVSLMEYSRNRIFTNVPIYIVNVVSDKEFSQIISSSKHSKVRENAFVCFILLKNWFKLHDMF